MHNRTTSLLLNIGHAIDHMFLLIFATAGLTRLFATQSTPWISSETVPEAVQPMIRTE